jgi:hypothetical protein
VGDTLVLMDPVLKTVTLEGLSYPTLQVLDPSSFLLNGTRLAKEQHARAQAVNQCM